MDSKQGILKKEDDQKKERKKISEKFRLEI